MNFAWVKIGMEWDYPFEIKLEENDWWVSITYTYFNMSEGTKTINRSTTINISLDEKIMVTYSTDTAEWKEYVEKQRQHKNFTNRGTADDNSIILGELQTITRLIETVKNSDSRFTDWIEYALSV